MNTKSNINYHSSMIQYKRERLTISEICEKIQSGYCFTHIFNSLNEVYGLREKTLNNFLKTNYIWIDIDNAPLDIHKLYSSLTNNPTIVYTTMSNTNQSYRYRLIYLLDFTIKTNEEYRYYLNILINSISTDLGKTFIKCIDKKCFNVSLQMYGSKKDCILIRNEELIYSNHSFIRINSEIKINNFMDLKCSINSNYNKEREEDTIHINRNCTTPETIYNQVLEHNKNHFNYQEYLSNTHIVTFASEDVYIDVNNQDIYEVNLYNSNRCKIQIGNRHNALFRQGIIIRNINPNIDIVELTSTLFSLYQNHYIQSNDFGLRDVVKIGEGVMRLNKETERFKMTGKKQYIFNKNYTGNITRKEKYQQLGIARRKRRDTIIQQDYDFKKTVVENSKVLGISVSTIYNFQRDNSLNSEWDKKYNDFVEVYNRNPKIRSIRKLSTLTGLSGKTIQKYKKRIENRKSNDLN